MPRRSMHGFTLVEVMIAAFIAVGLFIVTLDVFLSVTADSLRNRVETEVNEVCRRAMDRVKEDVESAGFRVNSSGFSFPPVAEIIPGGIRLRCLKEIGTLAVSAIQGAQTLTVDNIGLFAANSLLLYSYQGTTGLSRIASVDPLTNQITLANGLTAALPAGTWLAIVHEIDYVIQGGRLMRSVNSGPAVTIASIVEAGSGFTFLRHDGTTVITVNQINQGDNAWIDFTLNLTREGRIRGRVVATHVSTSQRVAFLGAQPTG